MVTDLLTTDGTSDDTARIPLAETPARSRKRPIVNQAERRWREERQNNISTAKQRIARMADRGDSDDESERLAQQLEQVALDLEGGMDTTATETRGVSPPRAKPASAKPPLKYQPRVPSKPRAGAATQESGVTDAMQPDAAQPTPTSGPGKDDDDDDYVYDTYIRQPLPSTQFPNPLASLETNQDAWFRQNGIDTSRPDVGIIVITPEDEQYWENFVEDDDEDRWDSEDADSNGKQIRVPWFLTN